MTIKNSKNVQIMYRKKGKWYCYFCGEEIKSLEDNNHWERAESVDVDIDTIDLDSQLETVTFTFVSKFKKNKKKGE